MMRTLAFILLGVGLAALAGHPSASASPTFSDSCFDTEEKAQKHQSYYEQREVDHSKTLEQDKLATALTRGDSVKVSELEAILGAPQSETDDITHVTTYTWTLHYIGSPSAGHVQYNPSRGYCVNTRPAGHGIVTFTIKTESFDKTQGVAERYEIYI